MQTVLYAHIWIFLGVRKALFETEVKLNEDALPTSK